MCVVQGRGLHLLRDGDRLPPVCGQLRGDAAEVHLPGTGGAHRGDVAGDLGLGHQAVLLADGQQVAQQQPGAQQPVQPGAQGRVRGGSHLQDARGGFWVKKELCIEECFLFCIGILVLLVNI